MLEREFRRRFDAAFGPMIDDEFPSKIAGASHPNADGTSRVAILEKCKLFEVFDLTPEPENPVDPKAVMILRNDTGEQVGYLPERTAHDLLPQMGEPGFRWFAVLHQFNISPETQALVGANIIVARMVLNRAAGPAAE